MSDPTDPTSFDPAGLEPEPAAEPDLAAEPDPGLAIDDPVTLGEAQNSPEHAVPTEADTSEADRQID